MHLKQLTLRQFRNYCEESFNFDPGLNVITGQNAAGKTNILEAVFFLSALFTCRTHNNKELIKQGEKGMSLTGFFCGLEKQDIHVKMYSTGRKEMYLNSKRCLKNSDITGKVPVVWFSPEDLKIVKEEPSIRRRWINFILSQTIKEYNGTLRRYQKTLIERNAALRQIQEGKLAEDMLSVWDEELSKQGIMLIKDRDVFISEILSIASIIHAKLSSDQENLNITYKPSIDIRGSKDPHELFLNRLNEQRSAERILGTTLKGPHRDELEFSINKMNLRSFGSQGQQRTVVLSLKLAEIEYIKAKLEECPIGLFDDVLSELDDERSRKFWQILKEQNPSKDNESLGIQCLITTVRYPEYIKTVSKPHIIEIQKKSLNNICLQNIKNYE